MLIQRVGGKFQTVVKLWFPFDTSMITLVAGRLIFSSSVLKENDLLIICSLTHHCCKATESWKIVWVCNFKEVDSICYNNCKKTWDSPCNSVCIWSFDPGRCPLSKQWCFNTAWHTRDMAKDHVWSHCSTNNEWSSRFSKSKLVCVYNSPNWILYTCKEFALEINRNPTHNFTKYCKRAHWST